MQKENEDLPCFPSRLEYEERSADGTRVKKIETHFGLTKLEYFTAAAMQGFLSNSSDWSDTEACKKWVAENSIDFALRTLLELEALDH